MTNLNMDFSKHAVVNTNDAAWLPSQPVGSAAILSPRLAPEPSSMPDGKSGPADSSQDSPTRVSGRGGRNTLISLNILMPPQGVRAGGVKLSGCSRVGVGAVTAGLQEFWEMT